MKVEDIHVFGRCMSINEYRSTLRTGLLVSPKGKDVPVFIATPDALSRIELLDAQDLRAHFREMSVTGVDLIVLFKVDARTLQKASPIQPQRGKRKREETAVQKMRKPIDTSWIFERKLPSGTPIGQEEQTTTTWKPKKDETQFLIRDFSTAPDNSIVGIISTGTKNTKKVEVPEFLVNTRNAA